MPRSGVTLTDEYGASTVEVKAPRILCAPADVADEHPTAPSHPDHLEGYRIKPLVKAAYPARQRVIDRFNPTGLFVDPRSPSHVLVPTAVDPTTPPPLPAEFSVPAFECYKVRVSSGTPKFTARAADVMDRLGQTTTVLVQKPRYLCNSVAVDDTPPPHPSQLVCYQVKQTSLPKFARVLALHVVNRFGPETLDAVKRAEALRSRVDRRVKGCVRTSAADMRRRLGAQSSTLRDRPRPPGSVKRHSDPPWSGRNG